MYKFGFKSNDKRFGSQIDTEIDEYGEVSAFDFKGKGVGIKYNKLPTPRARERKRYYTTGAHSLGTTYPKPYDREELIKKEHMHTNWYSFAIAVIIVTFLAIGVDLCCYFNLIEAINFDSDVGFEDVLSAIGAAVAIDVLPIFLAHNIHRISLIKQLIQKENKPPQDEPDAKIRSQKNILILFSVLNVLLFVVVVAAMTVSRELGKDVRRIDFWLNFILSCIPVATSMLCFIISYLSYNPTKKKLKRYSAIKLFTEESINESKALIAEFKAQPNYFETLKSQDDTLYDSAFKMIEKISSCYKSYTRLKIVPYLNSPADTTDLTARKTRDVFNAIQFPVNFDDFYSKLYQNIDNSENSSKEKESTEGCEVL